MSGLSEDFVGAADLVQTYGLKVFIETGCEEGFSLGYALSLGLQCFSCDVNEAWVNHCRAKYPARAYIHHALSTDFLAEELPRIKDPALIWLDAHFDPLAGDAQWPVRTEIQLLATLLSSCAQSVILVDDFTTIKSQWLQDPDNTRFQGSPQFVDYTTADLCAMLPYHEFTALEGNTGVGRWVPRTVTV